MTASRWIFEDHLEPLVRKRREEREARRKRKLAEQGFPDRVLSVFGRRATERSVPASHHEIPLATPEEGKKGKVKASMIRRMSNAPQRINPSGHVMDPRSSQKPFEIAQESTAGDLTPALVESPKSMPANLPEHFPSIGIRHPTEDVPVSPTDASQVVPSFRSDSFGLSMTTGRQARNHQSFSIPEERAGFQRTHTVEFSLSPQSRNPHSDVEGNIDHGRLSLVGSREENATRLSFTGEATSRSQRGEGFERCKHLSKIQKCPF